MLPRKCWCYQHHRKPYPVDKSKPAYASKMSKLAVGNQDRFSKQLALISADDSKARFCSCMCGEVCFPANQSCGLGSQTSLLSPAALHSPVPQQPRGPRRWYGEDFVLFSVHVDGSVLSILLELGVFISIMTRGKFECRLPEVLKQYRQSLMGQTPSSINLTIPIYPV